MLLTSTVVLDDLVVSIIGTPASGGRCSRGLLDKDHVLGHVLEPDVVDGARTLVVDALVLVSSDYSVAVGYMHEFGCIE